MKSDFISTLVKLIGYSIVLTSFIYLFFFLKNINHDDISPYLQDRVAFMFFLLMLCCALTNFFLVFSWRKLLVFFHGKSLGLQEIAPFYLKTFMARYLPGNIFHFVSRQLLGGRLGISQSALGCSSLGETLMLLVAGGSFILAGLVLGLYDATFLRRVDISYEKIIIIVGFGLALGLMIMAIGRRFVKVSGFLSYETARLVAGLWWWYSIYLVLNGIILYSIFFLMFEVDLLLADLPVIIGVHLLAWMVGFVTPGAPGGIGVREMIATLLLSDIFPAAIVLAGIIINRVMTMLGEMLTLGITILISYRTEVH